MNAIPYFSILLFLGACTTTQVEHQDPNPCYGIIVHKETYSNRGYPRIIVKKNSLDSLVFDLGYCQTLYNHVSVGDSISREGSTIKIFRNQALIYTLIRDC